MWNRRSIRACGCRRQHGSGRAVAVIRDGGGSPQCRARRHDPDLATQRHRSVRSIAAARGGHGRRVLAGRCDPARRRRRRSRAAVPRRRREAARLVHPRRAAHGCGLRRAGDAIATGAADGASASGARIRGRRDRKARARRRPVTALAFDPTGRASRRRARTASAGLARRPSAARKARRATRTTSCGDVQPRRKAPAHREPRCRGARSGTRRRSRPARASRAFRGRQRSRVQPDGRWIATAGPTTIGFWEARLASPHRRRHAEALDPRPWTARPQRRVCPDSRRVASTGDDGTVRTYLCELCGTADQLVRLARRRLKQLGANLTVEQRKDFLGG